MRAVPLLVAALLVPTSAFAADLPEWGEFTREELFSTHFPEAPDAGAVVLYDRGEIKVDKQFHLHFQRYRRTKIFAPTTAHAEVRIPFAEDDKIRKLRAHTAVPPSQFVKAKTSEERTADGGKVFVVRFQDVAPGVILEYSYEHWSKRIHRLDPWVFQGDDYTRVSRLDLLLPAGMSHHATFGWVPGVAPRATTASVLDPDDPQRQLVRTSWILRDLPAFREAPLLSNPADYRTTLYVQLHAFEGPMKTLEIAPGWDALGEPAATAWAEAMNDDGGVAEWAESAQGSGPAELARALYLRVRDEIALDGADPVRRPPPVRQVVQSGKGSEVAKSALLLKLLRDAGLKAHAVLVRPRSVGTFHSKWLVVEQLERPIIQVEVDGQPTLLSVASGVCPFGVVAPDLRVDSGLMLSPGGSGLVTFEHAPVESRSVVATSAVLDAKGSLAARTEWTLHGFDAMAARTAIAIQGEAEYVRQSLSARFGDAVVRSAEAIDLDERTLKVSAQFQVAGWATEARDRVQCRLPFVLAATGSPLPAGERAYPIDLGYPRTEDETVRLQLPDGFALGGSPPGERATTDVLAYSLAAKSTGATVSARRRFEVREDHVSGSRAPEVEGFYGKVVAADGASLVARKTVFSGSR